MRATGIVGIVLIVAGAIALVTQGFSFTREREVLDVGPIEATAETRETVGIPVWVSGLVIAAGVALVVMGRKRT
jgi:hypothetical protein